MSVHEARPVGGGKVPKGSGLAHADGPEKKSPYSGAFISQVFGLSKSDAISTVDSVTTPKSGLIIVENPGSRLCGRRRCHVLNDLVILRTPKNSFAAPTWAVVFHVFQLASNGNKHLFALGPVLGDGLGQALRWCWGKIRLWSMLPSGDFSRNALYVSRLLPWQSG